MLLQCKFQLKSHNGSGGYVKKFFFEMAAVAASLDFLSAKFYILSICSHTNATM